VDHQALTDREHTLLRSGHAPLEHQEVVLDDTIVRETTERCDGFVCRVGIGGTVLLVAGCTDTVNLLVELGTMMIAILTGTGDAEHDLAWMPCTDTSDLAQTFVGLPRQLLGAPTSGNTLKSVTFGDTNDIDDLVLFKDGGDRDLLLEQSKGKSNLVGDATSVDLDLHQVCLLLLQAGLADLCVGKDSNDGAVFTDSLQLALDALVTGSFGHLLGVLGESLFLAAVPVLVEATLDFIGQVGSPDGSQCAETTRSLDVSDDTDDNERWGFDNGDGLDDLPLMHFGARAIKITDDMGHTGLVAKSGGKMDGFLWVILWEGFDLSAMASSSFPRKKSKRTVSWSLVLAVTHF